jgi:hypothetical protein
MPEITYRTDKSGEVTECAIYRNGGGYQKDITSISSMVALFIEERKNKTGSAEEGKALSDILLSLSDDLLTALDVDGYDDGIIDIDDEE